MTIGNILLWVSIIFVIVSEIAVWVFPSVLHVYLTEQAYSLLLYGIHILIGFIILALAEIVEQIQSRTSPRVAYLSALCGWAVLVSSVLALGYFMSPMAVPNVYTEGNASFFTGLLFANAGAPIAFLISFTFFAFARYRRNL